MGNFVQQVQSQTWYPKVQQTFAAAGVPDAVWIATLQSEDASLNVAQDTPDPSPKSPNARSYGLFQLRQGGSADPGLGDGYNVQLLETPFLNSQIAADAMGAAIHKLPATASVTDKLKAVEDAGWPGLGFASPNDTRQKTMADVIQQMGISPAQAGVVGSTGAVSYYQHAPGSGNVVQDGLTNWWASTGVGIGHTVIFISITIAVIIGGFWLLASDNGMIPKAVPVPV